MYINFDEYPTYSGAISEYFETNINAHIQCDHDYPYSTIKYNMLTWIKKEIWEIMKTSFPDAKQIKKCPQQQYTKYAHMIIMKEKNSMIFLILPPDSEHKISK